MDMQKSYSVNRKLAKILLALVLVAIVSFGLYTFVIKAANVVVNAYVPQTFK